MKLLYLMSSLKLTFAGMLMLAGSMLVSYYAPSASPLWVAVPLVVLAANLVAALLVKRSFRRKPGLIIFHLGLLAVMLLAATGRLSSFKGRVEISEGQAFDTAAVTVMTRGPWHPVAQLDKVQFEQSGIRIDYAPGLRRGATRNTLHVPGEAGQRESFTIGDTRPFRSGGYRFYTTSNKGYAAVLSWTDETSGTRRGAVHFPSFPYYDWKQINTWTTPAGDTVDLEFHPARQIQSDRHWVLDSANNAGLLTVSISGQEAQTLRPSETIRLPGGILRYEGPCMWMGYEIFYDPALPWLLLAALVGVFGLAWHYWERFQPRKLAPETCGPSAVKEGVYVSG